MAPLRPIVGITDVQLIARWNNPDSSRIGFKEQYLICKGGLNVSPKI
jgi:hypothetical protein